MSYTKSPVGGVTPIAMRLAVVMRGIRRPDDVEDNSRSAIAFGVVVPMPTLLCAYEDIAQNCAAKKTIKSAPQASIRSHVAWDFRSSCDKSFVKNVYRIH